MGHSPAADIVTVTSPGVSRVACFLLDRCVALCFPGVIEVPVCLAVGSFVFLTAYTLLWVNGTRSAGEQHWLDA